MQYIIFITDTSKKFCSIFFFFYFLLKFHTCTALKHMMSIMYLNTDYELRIKTEYKVHIPFKCSKKKKKKKKKPVYTDHLLISELK